MERHIRRKSRSIKTGSANRHVNKHTTEHTKNTLLVKPISTDDRQLGLVHYSNAQKTLDSLRLKSYREIMGLVKYGDGVTNIAGGFGGQQFTSDKSGHHISAKPRRIRRQRSAGQTSQNRAFRAAVTFWKNNANPALIQAWSQFAHSLFTSNKLGEQTHITAFQAFIRINIIRARNNLALTTTPPTD